jgi:hypothetical protein
LISSRLAFLAMAFLDGLSDLVGGIAKAAGYGCIIYFVMYWIQWNQAGNRGTPPIFETVQQEAQQLVDKKKKDKRGKPSGKGLGGGLGPADPSSSEAVEEDEGKIQPNQVCLPNLMPLQVHVAVIAASCRCNMI